jgi:hypothetical protein
MDFSRKLRRFAYPTAFLAGACTPPAGSWLPEAELAPAGISTEAWVHAVAAHNRASLERQTTSSLLAVIDFSLPSTERRLWVVDVATGELRAHEFVAHGARSGGRYAVTFSNREGSNQSSLGTFITGRSYWGVRGLSLRLRGLESGINDRAQARGIVLHGTPNVSPARARQGGLGRTEGCPAVSMEAARRLVPMLEAGVVLFAWYPDPVFVARSTYLDPGFALSAMRGIVIEPSSGPAGRGSW